MKDLREQIIEILILDQSDGCTKTFGEVANEILALPLYPKEFLEWIVNEMQSGRLWHEDSDNTYCMFDWDYDYSLDELYEFWKDLSK
jgi:hypothetical protein